jgi:hypothetical protein
MASGTVTAQIGTVITGRKRLQCRESNVDRFIMWSSIISATSSAPLCSLVENIGNTHFAIRFSSTNPRELHLVVPWIYAMVTNLYNTNVSYLGSIETTFQ